MCPRCRPITKMNAPSRCSFHYACVTIRLSIPTFLTAVCLLRRNYHPRRMCLNPKLSPTAEHAPAPFGLITMHASRR